MQQPSTPARRRRQGDRLRPGRVGVRRCRQQRPSLRIPPEVSSAFTLVSPDEEP